MWLTEVVWNEKNYREEFYSVEKNFVPIEKLFVERIFKFKRSLMLWHNVLLNGSYSTPVNSVIYFIVKKSDRTFRSLYSYYSPALYGDKDLDKDYLLRLISLMTFWIFLLIDFGCFLIIFTIYHSNSPCPCKDLCRRGCNPRDSRRSKSFYAGTSSDAALSPPAISLSRVALAR